MFFPYFPWTAPLSSDVDARMHECTHAAQLERLAPHALGERLWSDVLTGYGAKMSTCFCVVVPVRLLLNPRCGVHVTSDPRRRRYCSRRGVGILTALHSRRCTT